MIGITASAVYINAAIQYTLLLHGDGTNLSETIVDSSPNALEQVLDPLYQLPVVVRTDMGHQYGAAALFLETSVDIPCKMVYSSSAILSTLNSGKWTVEFWLNTQGGYNSYVMSITCGAVPIFSVIKYAGLPLRAFIDEGTAYYEFAANTWKFFRISTKNNRTFTLYVDGIFAYSITTPTTLAYSGDFSINSGAGLATSVIEEFAIVSSTLKAGMPTFPLTA